MKYRCKECELSCVLKIDFFANTSKLVCPFGIDYVNFTKKKKKKKNHNIYTVEAFDSAYAIRCNGKVMTRGEIEMALNK